MRRAGGLTGLVEKWSLFVEMRKLKDDERWDESQATTNVTTVSCLATNKSMVLFYLTLHHLAQNAIQQDLLFLYQFKLWLDFATGRGSPFKKLNLRWLRLDKLAPQQPGNTQDTTRRRTTTCVLQSTQQQQKKQLLVLGRPPKLDLSLQGHYIFFSSFRNHRIKHFVSWRLK